VAVFKVGAATLGKYKNPLRNPKLVIDELPIAKSPIAAVKMKVDELEEAVPPKIECWESRTLKLLDDKLAPLDISAKTKLGNKNASIKTHANKCLEQFTI